MRVLLELLVPRRDARPLSIDVVTAIAASMKEIGQLNAIRVRPVIRAGAALMEISAGGHRSAAARKLGWIDIDAVVVTDDEIDAEMAMIDENLCRAELTPADRALYVSRRKELYLLKHPDTAQHVAGGKARQQKAATDNLSFAAQTAKTTGQDPRTVRRDASRGEKISEQALRALRGTRLDKGVVLDRLKQLPERDQVVYVEGALAHDRKIVAEAKEIRGARQRSSHAVRSDLAVQIAARQDASPWWNASGYGGGNAYPVVYADPPWKFKTHSEITGGEKSAENHYPTMDLDAICRMGCPASPQAALFLWVTDLANGLKVLEAWGFEFKSFWVWKKIYPGRQTGTGYWSFDNAEVLMIGTRGGFPAPLQGSQPIKCMDHPVGDHSAKPVWYAEQLDRLFPDMPKLEMFQRRASLAEGDIRLSGNWEFWGNQAGRPESEAA